MNIVTQSVQNQCKYASRVGYNKLQEESTGKKTTKNIQVINFSFACFRSVKLYK